MPARNKEFFIHVSQTEKRLFISRPESIKGDALSPCCMTPDDVDYEMAAGKDPEMLEICGMNQQSLEYFVQHYAKTYRYLSFFKCQLIQDFPPLRICLPLKRLICIGISALTSCGILKRMNLCAPSVSVPPSA